MRGKSFESLDHLNACLLEWITKVADQRVHGTTHRKPAEMFLEEKALLLDLQGRPGYTIQERAVRHVSKDCLVAFEANRYSVPFRLAGRQVEVQADGETVKIYQGGELVSSHPRLDGSYRSSIDKSHYWGLFRAAKPTAAPPDDVEVRDLDVYQSLVEGGVQ